MSLFSSDKKYPAFTLTELLVGMIVSGIVISTVWTAFHVVSELAQSSLSSETQVEEISFFKRSISTEFQNAQSVTKTEEGFSLLYPEPMPEVNYKFSAESVIRESNGRTDTFHVQTSGIVLENTGDLDVQDGARINGLKISVLVGEGKQDLILRRTLSSQEEMKSDD